MAGARPLDPTRKGRRTMKKALYATAILVVTGSAVAQDATKMPMSKTTPDSLKWMENKALPPGAMVAVMVGDPTKPGSVVVQRVKFPANYQVPPHTHPYDETVTIISGAMRLGMGEKVDPSATIDPPGTFFANPAKNAHYVLNGPQESVVQVQFVAPGGIDYINPEDDPRRKQ